MATEKFHYTTEAGDVITLPRMDQLKAGLLRRIRKMDPIDGLFEILEDAADKTNLKRVDDLQIAELNSLFEAWQGADSAGESGGSSS